MDTHRDDRTVVVAVAIDDAYIVPLLVMLRSACRRLSPGWSLEVFVLGYQIAEESKARLESALSGLPVRVRWRTVDLGPVRDYWPGIRNEADITAYYRLFLAEALPETAGRVLYLDVDVLVEGDLAQLWRLPFEGHVLQAVHDAYAGLLHLPRLKMLDSAEGFRFRDDTPYFNAGVLLVDLRRWREESIGKRAAAVLWKHGSKIVARDQDALNCALVGRWKSLPPAWNLHELPHLLYCWEAGSVSQAELRQSFRHPQIIHFIGHWKPWGDDCCQTGHENWRRVAREAMIPEVRPPWPRRLRQWLIWRPHAKLNWHVWRDVVQAPDPSGRRRIAVLLLKHPWMLLTYPAWQAWVWVNHARI